MSGNSTSPLSSELRLTVGGQTLSGWQRIRVTRGIERMPSDFDIEVTEKFPGQPHGVVILPGDVCKVAFGADLVLTGYVDRYLPSISGDDHTIRVMGRSACEDLVDCSVIWPNNQLSSTSIRDAASSLAKPYGVLVRALNGDGPAVPQINIQLGETPYELIERIARFGAMLVYDDPTGNLVLAQVGKDAMGSGAREGENIEAAQVTFTVDERFTEYHPYLQASFSLGDAGPINGNALPVVKDAGMAELKRVDGQPRVRQRAIISDQPIDGQDLATVRAKWEMARRYGRSQVILVVVDSWRDAKGRLWEPNTSMPVHIPSCKIDNQTMVISEVSFLRGERGTQARLTLMPAGAFTPEPTILVPFLGDVRRELDAGAQGPANPPPGQTPRGDR